MNPRTIYQVLEESAAQFGDAPALRQPSTGKGGQREYLTYSWNQYKTAAQEIAAGLRSIGIRKGDVVALDSETRLEFYLADLGILAAGSVAAALYPSYPPKDLIRTIQNCGAKALFVEGPKILEALRAAPDMPRVLLTGEAEGALSLDQLRERGRLALAEDAEYMARLKAEVTPADYAILYLTSGATGEPKMALVTHAAVVANMDMAPTSWPIGPQDATVAFLPSAHIAQRIVGEMLPLRMGTPVSFSESLLKLPQDIREVRPTVMLAPPRMWERIYSTICTELRKRPAVARKAFYGALGLGLAAANYKRQGKTVPARIRVPLKMADRLFFQKVRARLGGRLAIAASGAAPLSKELAEFYEAIGMPLVEGYGLTEGGVVTLNPLQQPKAGSIGKALPGVELRIAEQDSELLIKSECVFSKYLGDPEATAEVLRDGWLHTGDIAFIDDEGFVFITGRKKELIVSSTGKKIHPSRVESLFKFEPLISQIMLVGDRLPYLTALFTINPSVAETLKGMDMLKGHTTAEMSAAEPVQKEIRKVVERVNKQLAPFEQIRKYRVLGRDFSIEDGELTATMKVRRARVMENFRESIEELYAGKEA
ncbi:MAG TPA: AMP-dependent synthetase/ligase [Bryobacteraceae bacterium]|jgi:long-chain acyl-CoA synthetase|nr:AMP-dependent synthetase/ligase [Bryobacteraceae bacterium]